jgi:hypothetical protein
MIFLQVERNAKHKRKKNLFISNNTLHYIEILFYHSYKTLNHKTPASICSQIELISLVIIITNTILLKCFANAKKIKGDSDQ